MVFTYPVNVLIPFLSVFCSRCGRNSHQPLKDQGRPAAVDEAPEGKIQGYSLVRGVTAVSTY